MPTINNNINNLVNIYQTCSATSHIYKKLRRKLTKWARNLKEHPLDHICTVKISGK